MSQISIIVPVYKVEKYLPRCVDSILSQSLTDFELILVEDGSPDNCSAICDEYVQKDSRVYVIHQKNGGLSAARNAGIDWVFANSNSQWLTFIDSDDWIHPDYLCTLLHAATSTNLSLSVCGFVRTSGEEPTIPPEMFKVTVWNPEDFYIEDNVTASIACCKLYKKECFCNIRYPVGKIQEDEYTTYKLLFPCRKLAVVAAPLYYYLQNPVGIMSRPWTPQKLEKLDAYEEQLAYFRENSYSKAYMCSLQNYFLALKYESQNLLNCNSPYPKVQRKLKRRYRKVLTKYGKEVNYTLGTVPHIYEQLYPTRMWFYWTAKSLANKISALFRK